MKTLIETLPRETFTRLESLLICLLMSLLSTAAQAQAPVELTSITSTTNGVRVAWTDPGPGQAYSVVFANAEVAYQSFTNRGACCVSVVDPGAPAQLNHDDCYAPSLRGVLTWFETLRQ